MKTIDKPALVDTLACIHCAYDHLTLRHLEYDFIRDIIVCPVHGVIITCEQLYTLTYKVSYD